MDFKGGLISRGAYHFDPIIWGANFIQIIFVSVRLLYMTFQKFSPPAGKFYLFHMNFTKFFPCGGPVFTIYLHSNKSYGLKTVCIYILHAPLASINPRLCNTLLKLVCAMDLVVSRRTVRYDGGLHHGVIRGG